MTYKEKLKTCPVCGKPHGLRKKIIAFSKQERLICENCGAKLMRNIISTITYYSAIPIFLFLQLYHRYAFRNIVVDIYKLWLIATLLIVFGLYFGVILALKPYHNYWQEFWDKDLK